MNILHNQSADISNFCLCKCAINSSLSDLNNTILRFNLSSEFSACSSAYTSKGIITGIVYKTVSDYPTQLADTYSYIMYISAYAGFGTQLLVGGTSGKLYTRCISDVSNWTPWHEVG